MKFNSSLEIGPIYVVTPYLDDYAIEELLGPHGDFRDFFPDYHGEPNNELLVEWLLANKVNYLIGKVTCHIDGIGATAILLAETWEEFVSKVKTHLSTEYDATV